MSFLGEREQAAVKEMFNGLVKPVNMRAVPEAEFVAQVLKAVAPSS